MRAISLLAPLLPASSIAATSSAVKAVCVHLSQLPSIWNLVASVLTEISSVQIALQPLLLCARRDDDNALRLRPCEQDLFWLGVKALCDGVDRLIDGATRLMGERDERRVAFAGNAVSVPELDNGELLVKNVGMEKDLSMEVSY